MKGLTGLIKVEQQQLETKRKALADLEQQRAQCENQLVEIARDIEAEGRVAEEAPDTALDYSRFLTAAMARRRNVQSTIDSLDRDIEIARGAVADAYRELRKYELAHERAEKARALTRRRRDQTKMDDIGMTLHRRKAGGDLG